MAHPTATPPSPKPWLDHLGRLMDSLSFKLSFTVGLIVFAAVLTAAYVNIQSQKERLLNQVQDEAEDFAETVRRATYWSMLNNQRESQHRIIQDVAARPGIVRMRVFNAEGTIQFSSDEAEIGSMVDKQAEACYACHAADTPLVRLPPGETTRVFGGDQGRVLSTILPIYNEPACHAPPCHAHPADQQVLGVLDVTMDLDRVDRHMSRELRRTMVFAVVLFLAVSTIIGLAILLTVNRSVDRMVGAVDRVSAGQTRELVPVSASGELGRMAQAINRMAQAVSLRDRENELRYQNLVQNSTDAVLVTDPEGRVVMHNPEMARLAGLEAPAESRLELWRLLDARDRDLVARAMAQAQAQPGPTPLLTFSIQGLDGRARVVEGRFRRLRDQDFQGVLANLTDVTQRHQLQNELNQRKDFEERLIAQALNAILATDPQGVVQVVNQSAEQLLGVKAAEVLGREHYGRFFPEPMTRLIEQAVFGPHHRPRGMQRPAVALTADGRRVAVMLGAQPIFKAGQPAGAVLFLQSMQEAKELRSRLIHKERLAAIGQTAAGLAHCIKNLTHGLGQATHIVDLGLAEADLELAGQGWVMIKRNLEQMTSLTQDLLFYAKDARPQYQWFDLNRLLDECRQFMSGRVQDLGVNCALETDPTCDRVRLDPVGVRRVVLNLLANALDALAESPPAGEAPRVLLSSGRDGFGHIVVRVEDNGPGLSAEAAQRLFQGLYTSKGGKGTGLGLLVSQKIAEDHGGAISHAPRPGGGVRFVLALPEMAPAATNGQTPG